MGRPRKYAERMVRIQPYLPPEHIQWLNDQSAKYGTSVGEVIRVLIEDAPEYPSSKARVRPVAPVVGASSQPHVPSPDVEHEWIVDLTSRNVCKHCRLPKNAPSTPLACGGPS